MSVFFIIFWFLFKVNSGVFLHNRVATLAGTTVGSRISCGSWRLFKLVLDSEALMDQ